MESRLASAQELPILEDLARQIWPGTYAHIISHEQIDFMLNWMYSASTLQTQLNEGHEFYILSAQSKDIGFIALESTNYQNQASLKINKLYVLAAFQGNGAGQLLLQKAKESAQVAGIDQLFLQVNKANSAVQFYLKNGFVIQEEAVFDIGNGFVMDDYVMTFSRWVFCIFVSKNWSMLKIDMHSHILPKTMPNWTQKFGYGKFIHLEPNTDGSANMMQGGQFFRRIMDNCWDEQLRIEEYKPFRTQVQVVCTIPVMFSYWAKTPDALELSRFLNDHISDLVVRYPKNYIGLATIPMQDPDAAILELERAKAIGLVGIQIGSNINDENLNEEKFFPIFEACARLGMAVMIHPWQMMGFDSMKKYWLPWLVGMPAETSRAACSLIFGGVLERLPELRVCFSHAGGSFLPTLGRIEHGFNCRPDLVAVDNPNNPRTYLGKFWVDSITHDIDAFEYILKMQGSKRVCLGSDYPFPLGDLEIGQFIEDSQLSAAVKEDIFCNATLEWLQLDKSQFINQ